MRTRFRAAPGVFSLTSTDQKLPTILGFGFWNLRRAIRSISARDGVPAFASAGIVTVGFLRDKIIRGSLLTFQFTLGTSSDSG